MNNALLTLTDAAATLSLGKTTLRKLIEAGEIRVVRIGGLVRVPRSEIQRWIDSRLETASSGPVTHHPLRVPPGSADRQD
jgi:excisionase family DNA binding protein